MDFINTIQMYGENERLLTPGFAPVDFGGLPHIPYGRMVIDVVGKAGWGALRFSLNFLEDTLGAAQKDSKRPWCLLECSNAGRLFLPAFSSSLRQAAGQGRLIWVQADETTAPKLAQTLLQSGLCAGVLVHGLENFSKAQPASLWGRRWQLAAQKGDSHLLWLHQKSHPVIGFDVKLEWVSPQNYEIKKGYGHFNEQRLKKTLLTQSSAA